MNRAIFLTLLRKELREFTRTHRFIIGVYAFVLLAILAPVGARFIPEILGSVGRSQGFRINLPATTFIDSLLQYVRNIAQIAGVAVILLSMGSISIEFDQGTAEFLFVKPVPRTVFVLAKLTAVWILLIPTLLFASVFGGGGTFLLYGELPLVAFFQLNGLLFIYLGVLVSLSVMASALFVSQAVSSIVAAAIWIGLVLAARIEYVGAFSPEGLVGRASALALGTSVGPSGYAAAAGAVGVSSAVTGGAAALSSIDALRPYIGAVGIILVAVLITVAATRNWEP